MGPPLTTEILDMEDRNFKEGQEAKELRTVTIITLGEVEVVLRPMDVQTRTLVARKELEAKEENHFTKVVFEKQSKTLHQKLIRNGFVHGSFFLPTFSNVSSGSPT